MAQLTFWFEFASTYSYLSAMRIEDAAGEAGVKIIWRPFLLGPIFKGQGWDTSPFNLYPAKGGYMVRDITRIAEERGLLFKLPSPFPQNGLLAARVSLAGLASHWGSAFIKAVYRAQFAGSCDISAKASLAEILSGLGLNSQHVFEEAESPQIKAKLKENTEEAQRLGIFGAPSFTTAGGELFWGDDRLKQALTWAKR